MTKIVIKKFVWTGWNIEHIKKHGVTVKEVESVAASFLTHAKGRNGKYRVFGRSGDRVLTLIVGRESVGVYFLLTARDASKKERKLLYEKEKL